MSDVRAKFRCESKTIFENDRSEIKLYPVTTGSEENKAFWKYTPGGSMVLNIDNKLASERFQPGMEYYVDFTKA